MAARSQGREPNRAEYLGMVRRSKRFIALALAASFIVLLLLAVFGGFGRVISIILSANPVYFAMAILFVLLSYLVRFVKWLYLLRRLKIQLPLWKGLAIYLSAYSMELTPGRAGRVVVGYTLDRVTKKRFMKVAPIVTMDIFSDFLGFALLTLFAAFFFKKYIIYVVFAVALLSITFLFVLNDKPYRFLREGRYTKGFMRRFSPSINTYFASQNVLGDHKTYAVSTMFAIPADVLNASALYFSLLALGFVPNIGQVIFVFAVAQIFGMVSFIPGNIGVTDAALVTLIGATFGTNSAINSAATILTRIATLWFGVLLGMAFLIYTMRYWIPRRGGS